MTGKTIIASTISALLLTAVSGMSVADEQSNVYQYSSKATYQPQQDWQDYEAAPDGYHVVFTQLVERHGARALSSPKYDVLSKQVWELARIRGQLTPLGEKLGPAIDKVTAANEKLGYGLLTKVGAEEPAGIALRLTQRLQPIFTNSSDNPVCIQVQTSGKERANQTAYYFMESLAKNVSFVENDPEHCYEKQNQPDQIDKRLVNKFELYFHKTNPKKSDQYREYANNYAAYKEFKDSDKLEATFDALENLPKTKQIARQMLERIYTKEYVDFLETQVSNDKSCDVAADNCFKTNTKKADEVEDDWKYVQSDVDAASMLYNMFIIGPGMLREAQDQGGEWDLKQFITPEESAWFSYLSDAEDFYEKGPSFSDGNGVTYNIAKSLLNDMFNEVSAVASNTQTDKHIAKLRFAHAEQIMPLAALLHVEGSEQSAKPSVLYSQGNNPWRGGWVTPYSANIQWDVYMSDSQGSDTLVRMLYNEKEIGFKSDCKVFPGTQYFYSLTELKRCYKNELAIN